jgi:hypothetical protein
MVQLLLPTLHARLQEVCVNGMMVASDGGLHRCLQVIHQRLLMCSGISSHLPSNTRRHTATHTINTATQEACPQLEAQLLTRSIHVRKGQGGGAVWNVLQLQGCGGGWCA